MCWRGNVLARTKEEKEQVMVRPATITLAALVLTSGHAHAVGAEAWLREFRAAEADAAEKAEEAARQQHLNRYGQVELHNDGTVTIHGRQWMRCSLGQQWEPDHAGATAGRCSGNALTVDWREAFQTVDRFNRAGGFAGHADWRLPSIAELEILRLCSAGKPLFGSKRELPDGRITFGRCTDCGTIPEQPALDQQVFPNTPMRIFWSGSQAGNSNQAWVVAFGPGALSHGGTDESNYVRLVRGEP
jgi:hypothetical protein